MADSLREETDPLLNTEMREPRAPKIIRRAVVALALAAVATGAARAHRLRVSTVSALPHLVNGWDDSTPSIQVDFVDGCPGGNGTTTRTISPDGIGHRYTLDGDDTKGLVEFTYDGTNGDIFFDISTNGKCPCGDGYPNACWCPCSGQDGCGCTDNDRSPDNTCDGTVFFSKPIRILAIQATTSPQCALGEWGGGYTPWDIRGFSTKLCQDATCDTAYLTPKSGPQLIVRDTGVEKFVVEWCAKASPTVSPCTEPAFSPDTAAHHYEADCKFLCYANAVFNPDAYFDEMCTVAPFSPATPVIPGPSSLSKPGIGEYNVQPSDCTTNGGSECQCCTSSSSACTCQNFVCV